LPQDWGRHLPSSAPLRTLEHWRKALEAEDRRQVADLVLEVIKALAEGLGAAEAAGGLLLGGAARELWRRALAQAPATALDRELASLRIREENDPAACIAWMPASSLASTPRRHVWLLGLNAQSWPRRPTEDPLLPKRILGDLELEETTVSTADRLSFEAIMASAGTEVVRSYSRREATTRRLGVSPLVAGDEPEILYRTQIPQHATSEPDRLMARPDEFVLRDDARKAGACWRAWRNRNITEHDGWIKHQNHPATEGALKRSQSAHSLTLLLRNPIGFMWRYALGMQAPELDGDSLDMNARAFGNLVHEVLDRVIVEMFAKDGLAWTHDEVGDLVDAQLAKVAERWEREEPIPPRMLWVDTLARASVMVLNALLYPFEPLPGQRSYSEVPFGNVQSSDDGPVPWNVHAVVSIPHTGLTISGRIDRVDVSGDKTIARVVDYKTGRRSGDFVLRGGRELQRCLYAYAVQGLLGSQAVIDAGLLYPSQEPGNPAAGAYDPLPEPGENLDRLTNAIAAAETNLRAGLARPGVAAGLRYSDDEKPNENTYRERDDFIFALPVVPGTMLGPKKEAARKMLGDTITQFWDLA
jgi:RecB family exonuclease